MLNKLIAAAIFTAVGCVCYAQSQPKVCGTTEMYEQAVKNDPAYLERQADLEKFSQWRSSNTANSQSQVPLYTIPVVFHIIHDYGDENISKAQVLDAMRLINESFQKLSADTGDVIPDFQSIFADCEIEFRLAQLDPNGNCTDGITRSQSPLTFDAGDNVKNVIRWPHNQYLNIWVVDNIASGAAGYAYYPGASSQIDGIVILHDYSASIGTAPGSTYNSRALSHEIGHYLNLMHTWGNSNTPGDPGNCFIDDNVSDTPLTIGISNFSCNLAQATCGSPLDNVQNYMDYGSCPKMFTDGQKYRMHDALNSFVGQRYNLWQSGNLIATGTDDAFVPSPCTPVADFSDKNYMICTGDSIQFEDASWRGTPDTWLWDFPGGTPSTSADQNPSVTYNTPGIYNVTLTVTNAAGSDTKTRTGIIVVTPAAANYAIPYSEGFESLTSFPGTNLEWFVNNTNGTAAWDLTSAAAYTGVQSLKLNNFNGNTSGQVDEFITPSYDLTNVTNANLSFRVAFARKTSTSSDQLRVYASKDCGLTWAIRYNKTGSALATVPGTVTSNYVPVLSDWRLDNVNIASSTYNNQPNVRFKFNYTQATGNNIYIDDLNLNGTVGIGENIALSYEVGLQPNPATNETYLSFTLEKVQHVIVSMVDVLGKEMMTPVSQLFEQGENLVRINAPESSGMFILKLESNEGAAYQRVVFNKN